MLCRGKGDVSCRGRCDVTCMGEMAKMLCMAMGGNCYVGSEEL